LGSSRVAGKQDYCGGEKGGAKSFHNVRVFIGLGFKSDVLRRQG
jgi:hypothetical protein